MAKLSKDQIENLSAEDMRDFMYGEVKSMIEGNVPDNVCFHYFMPPIPFGAELAAFMDIGPKAQAWRDQGFTVNDLMRSAVNFAAIVDYVPAIGKTDDSESEVIDINTLISSGVQISKVYKSILNNCRVFNNERSLEDQDKLKRLRAMLFKPTSEEHDGESPDDTLSDDDLLSGFDDDGDVNLDELFSDGASTGDIVEDPNKISEPTQAMKLYDALFARYDAIDLQVTDELRSMSPNDPNASRRRRLLAKKLRNARDRWEAQGRKTKVESILARIEQLSQGGMPQYLADLRALFEGSQIHPALFSDAEFGQSLLSEEGYYTALRPNGILNAEGMLKVKISSSSMNSERKFKKSRTSGGVRVPFSFGTVGAGGSKLSENRSSEFFSESFEISFDIVQGLVDRPWLDMAFLQSRAYTTIDPRTNKALDPVTQITQLSDGKIPPEEGMVKCLPVTVYFIRNLKIRSRAFASLSQTEIDKISGRASVSLFGFGSHASHSNETINTSYSQAGTMGEITANGTYLIAMSSVYLKKSPNPNFDAFPVDQWI